MNIPIYVRYYFDCRLGQLLSYLKFKRIPIEVLFYSLFINPSKILEHTVIQNKRVWQFKDSIINDELQLFGIERISYPLMTFEEAKVQIKKIIDDDNVVFLFGAANELKYNTVINTGVHSIMIIGYSEDSFQIQDYNPDFSGNLSEEELRKYYEGSTHRNKIVDKYEFDITKYNEYYKKLAVKYKEWAENLIYTQELYHYFLEHIDELSDNNGLVDSMEQAFSLISGSRFLFSQFFDTTNSPQNIKKLLLEISKAAEIIKMLVLKVKLTGKVNKASLIKHCEYIIKNESFVFEYIKNNQNIIIDYMSIAEKLNKSTNEIVSKDMNELQDIHLNIQKYLERLFNNSEDTTQYLKKINFDISLLEEKLFILVGIINYDVISMNNSVTSVEVTIQLKDMRTKLNFPQKWLFEMTKTNYEYDIVSVNLI